MIDRQSLLELMNVPDAVYLATVDGSVPRIRALNNLRRQDLYPGAGAFCRARGFRAYFATSVSSGKVREIRANPAVSVYYCDPKNYRGVTLAGKMEVLSDPDLKRALWQDEWLIYWPAAACDPDYAVLCLQPAEATGWWGSAAFHFEIDS